MQKPRSGARRTAVRIAGAVLIAVAAGMIAFAATDMLNGSAATANSLAEAEKLLADSSMPPMSQDQLREADQMLSDMDAYMPSASNEANSSPDASGLTSALPSAFPTPRPTIEPGTVIGLMMFPTLEGRKIPLIEGADSEELVRGAAHHPRSSRPGDVGNCVIFGHRDTVFSGFGNLHQGDKVVIAVPGKIYTYVIQWTAVVQPKDSRIFQAYPTANITLITCYPFNYVGAAPQRFIAVAAPQ